MYFKFTGGEFFTNLGFDMYYNTKFHAPAYLPHIGSFFNQREKEIGNYPYVDIFLNVKLKRALFFFKFEHVNSGLFDRNFFSALHYPRGQRMFKLGIAWNFYD
ncbi:MAG: putative porin [Bacteroidales bacterium]|nr:putative porin [Bacteroidales bacterium]